MRAVPGSQSPAWPTLPRGVTEPRWWLFCVLYLAFVVYGSLVPLEWRDLPFDEAVARFSHIGFLNLGAASRADWVANIVLYVPLAFLGCATLFGLRLHGLLAPGAALLVFLLCVVIAVAVEFAQIFFAPRTVSLNDLLAEAIGAAIGVSLWLFGRWRVVRLGIDFARGGRASVRAALVVFVIAYLLLSLFPYDFVVSRAELEAVLQGRSGLFALGCGGWLRCAAFWLVEVVAIAPLGLLLVLLYPRLPLWWLVLLGLGVGFVLEPLQLLLVSGESQLLSVPLRGLGTLLGAALARLLTTRLDIAALAALAWRLVPWLALPYLLALTAVSGWWSGAWSGIAPAAQRLASLGWVPFYYHYWTSEPVAMASLLSQLAMYAPVGLACWTRELAGIGRPPSPRTPSPWLPAGIALLLALLIETGKLFAPGARPDPTNLIIGAAGAWLAYAVATWFGRVLSGSAPAPAHACAAQPMPDAARPGLARSAGLAPTQPGVSGVHHLAGGLRGPRPEQAAAIVQPAATIAAPASEPPAAALGPVAAPGAMTSRGARSSDAAAGDMLPEPSTLGYFYALGCGAAVLAGVALYSLAQVWLAVALALFGAALWRWPWLWLAVVPATLPVLDLTPWSGRVLLSAFDLFVLVGLGVVGLRLSGIKPARLPNAWVGSALLLLWLSWLVSTGIGLAAVQGGELPLAASHPPLAPWHEGKGLLWALLAVPLLRRFRRLLGSTAAALLVLRGAVIGLGLVCASVLFERILYVGLFDLDDAFRVTGPFASMHDGGAHIEAYLAFAFPMLLVWMLLAQRRWQQALGVLLLGIAAYAVLVTFSRGGYGAFAVSLLVVVLGLLASAKPLPKTRWWGLVGVLALVGVAAVPALTTGFAGERLARTGADLDTRFAHWHHALGLMGNGPLTTAFGEGFGRYPLLYLFSPPPGQPVGTFEVRQHNGNGFLRLGKGDSVYLDQRVRVRAQTGYRLSLRLRGDELGAGLRVLLCEKALLYSFTCVWTNLTPEAPGQWQTLRVQVHSGQVGGGGRWPHGPVKLSLYNAGNGAVDVDGLSLESPQGRELIANGGFEDGAERWLFVTDRAQPWHIDQLLVETYFAQGVVGLSAMALLLVAAFARLLPAIRAGRFEAVAFAGALAGFLSVGLLGSTLDAPRTAQLFFLGLFCAVLLVRGADRKRRRRKGRALSGEVAASVAAANP